MFDGLFGPTHLLVFFVGFVLPVGAILFIVKRIVTRRRRAPEFSDRELADRWKENADPFRGAP
jgi:hypothetical protein